MMRHNQKKTSSRHDGDYRSGDMADLLRRSGINLSPRQLEQLWIYHTLLRRHNAELNLTRIHNFNNMVQKLYIDSILPGRLIDLPSSLLDIGTGPGMPGIPLKIVYPRLKMVLAESRGKRVDFLTTVVERIQLENITVVGKTITADFDTPVRGVITRAVEEISLTLDRISGCLTCGGLAIFMKGPDCDDEVGAAIKKFANRFQLLQQINYNLPLTTHARRLVVFQRLDEPVRERRSTAMNQHAFRSIESEQNGFFKELKRLLSGRGIRKQQMALISGSKQVLEILKDFPVKCRAWITAAHHLPPPKGTPGHVIWYQLSDPLFRAIDMIGTDAPLLLIDTPPIRQWSPTEGLPPGCSVMIPFQDPENVGAVIRSAVAFGVDNIILLSESAHPYHPKALRASGGVIMNANLLEGPSLKDISADLPIIALSCEGRDISTVEFPETFAFLPGIEGQGLPAGFRSRSVAIPIRMAVESLNAATASAIAFYVWANTARTDTKSVGQDQSSIR